MTAKLFQPDGKGGGALESGIDTASSSTPLELVVDIGIGQATPIVVDMYVVHDFTVFLLIWLEISGSLYK